MIKVNRRKATPKPNKNWAHVVIIDGTLSKLTPEKRTHCGRLYKLLREDTRYRQKVYYDPGVQGEGWTKWLEVASGRGINQSVIRTFRELSENYQDGDRIFLFGFSRGAYAVRLLAGMIDKIGLLQSKYATPEFANKAFAHFAKRNPSKARLEFKAKRCDADIAIDFIGVWDTVKALGLPLPFLRRFTPLVVEFSDHKVPACVKSARHALAFHEIRKSYRAETWRSKSPGTDLEQMIFPGSHPIVGGQVYHIPHARDLSNLSLHWMLEHAEFCGLKLPQNWQADFPQSTEYIEDPTDNKWYWSKAKRRFIPSELFDRHPSLNSSS